MNSIIWIYIYISTGTVGLFILCDYCIYLVVLQADGTVVTAVL
jgi:hypothetical protein